MPTDNHIPDDEWPFPKKEVADALEATRPAGDPRLAAIATRLRSLRVDLDRMDDQLDLLPRPMRVELTRYSLHMRAALDSLESAVEKLGAGL